MNALCLARAEAVEEGAVGGGARRAPPAGSFRDTPK